MASTSGGKKILGQSKAIKDMLKMIDKVAPTKTNVLIIGESGTGKELVARLIHELSPVKDKAFIPVNCGAIPETLIESEMFGHKKGSFTGAVVDKMGLFEAANGGTLFLDEVGELPLSMQVKLLRSIQDRSIRKVGGTETIKVDVRLIAATNRDLEAAVKAGTFREDLYYRLNVILIKTPPLRDRKGDIVLLAQAFLSQLNEKYGKSIKGFAPEAAAAIENYPWPGNVRELENVIQRAITLENTESILLSSLPEAMVAATTGVDMSRGRDILVPPPDFPRNKIKLDDIIAIVEKPYLEAALRAAKGDENKAAEFLSVPVAKFKDRLSRYKK